MIKIFLLYLIYNKNNLFINNLILENGYTELNIGKLTKKLNYEGSYGSLSIEEVPTSFESIDIANYSPFLGPLFLFDHIQIT
jgi:hypothetical protein